MSRAWRALEKVQDWIVASARIFVWVWSALRDSGRVTKSQDNAMSFLGIIVMIAMVQRACNSTCASTEFLGLGQFLTVQPLIQPVLKYCTLDAGLRPVTIGCIKT